MVSKLFRAQFTDMCHTARLRPQRFRYCVPITFVVEHSGGSDFCAPNLNVDVPVQLKLHIVAKMIFLI